MRVYLNAQFASGNHRERLLSVGLASEAGEFYRVIKGNNAVEHARRDPWMREHVLARLPYDEEGRDWHWTGGDGSTLVSERQLVDDLLDFIDAHPEPELWAWQGAFAYVAVRHLFGPVTDRPAGFPGWCGELASKWVEAGKPELPSRGENGHHALEQARWARDVDGILTQLLG